MLNYGGNGDGGKSVAFGTAIQYLIPPDKRGKTRVTTLSYTDGGTVHTITAQRVLGRTTANGVNAAGQAVLNLMADPGAPAYGGGTDALVANDFIAVRESDGITRLYKISSVSTLAFTLTANLAVGTLGGESVWHLGVPGDTDGRTGNTNPAFKSVASTLTTFTDTVTGVVASIANDEPILISSNNITATGTLNQLTWAFTIN